MTEFRQIPDYERPDRITPPKKTEHEVKLIGNHIRLPYEILEELNWSARLLNERRLLEAGHLSNPFFSPPSLKFRHKEEKVLGFLAIKRVGESFQLELTTENTDVKLSRYYNGLKITFSRQLIDDIARIARLSRKKRLSLRVVENGKVLEIDPAL